MIERTSFARGDGHEGIQKIVVASRIAMNRYLAFIFRIAKMG
jgi:hypothetical protein